MLAVLRCPKCHKRKEVPFEDYCKSLILANERYRCDGELCEKEILLFHK